MLLSSWKCYVDSTLRTLRGFNVENWTWNQLSYITKYQRGNHVRSWRWFNVENITLIQHGKHHVDSTLKTRGFNVENTWNQRGKHDVESTWKTRRWFNFQIEPNINVETTSGHDVDSTWIQRNCACWVMDEVAKELKLKQAQQIWSNEINGCLLWMDDVALIHHKRMLNITGDTANKVPHTVWKRKKSSNNSRQNERPIPIQTWPKYFRQHRNIQIPRHDIQLEGEPRRPHKEDQGHDRSSSANNILPGRER